MALIKVSVFIDLILPNCSPGAQSEHLGYFTDIKFKNLEEQLVAASKSGRHGETSAFCVTMELVRNAWLCTGKAVQL